MTRDRLIWLICGGVLIAACGAWGWRAHQRGETLRGSVPPRPTLAALPAELGTRIATREQLLTRGDGTTATLAELAQLYHANGFLTEAATCYRGLLQLDAANPRWRHRLAAIYAGFGRLDEAAALWRRALAHDPNYVAAQVRLGDALVKLNDAAGATVAYEAALRLEPRHPHALAGLARLDMAASRWSQARTRLEQAAESSQGRIGGDLLATVCEQLGDAARAAAIRARGKSSGAYHDPTDPWMEEILVDCYDAYRLTVAAGFADHAGDRATAQRLIDRALLLAPDNASALFQRATFALARRDYTAARADFEACVRVAPEFTDAWARLISIHNTLGNSAAAERALASGLARSPNSPVLLVERATRLTAAGRDAEAITLFEEALRQQPIDADIAVKLATAYFRRERIADGVKALQGALAAEPDHPAALTTLTLHAIGAGDEDAARKGLRQIEHQVRIPRELLEELRGEFRKRFGRAP